MKTMKRMAGVLLALVMALALTVPAFAEETMYSITINNSATGHTYEAYQIFAGDLATNEAGGKVLSNIVWGSGISEDGKTALGDAAAKAETLKTEADAKAFAKEVAPYLTTAAGSDNTVTDGKYVISGLAAGYYLVKDQDGSLAGDNDVYTDYIIRVVSDTTATPKSSMPKVEKKTKDINDSTGISSSWQDSADYDIGDSVPFQLKATLADNVSSYTTYKVVFHDTLSKGLTYNNDAKVYIDGTETNGFTVTTGTDKEGNPTLTISCDDVKALGAVNNSVITVEYTATLNASATVGSTGNSNKVKLEYSNNPNKSESGNNETGNTPEDTVVVFTYKTIINKVDSEQTPLTGAEFTLEKYYNGVKPIDSNYEEVKEGNVVVGYWKPVTVVKNTEGTTFTISGLDDGKYRLTETVTPAGYNTIDPITFEIKATHTDGDNPELTVLQGDKVVGEIAFTPDLAAGSLSANVVNQAGAVLPETGGMGTTLFYILGSVLVLGAGVLLVVKKRMGADK